jgi:hypothetical protein
MEQVIKDKETLIQALLQVITGIPMGMDCRKLCQRLEDQIRQSRIRKEKLLDLSIAGALEAAEFKARNDGLNDQIRHYEAQLEKARHRETKHTGSLLDAGEIRRALEEALRFDGPISSPLAASILEKAIVKKESTKQEIHLDIFLKLGRRYEAVYAPEKTSARIICLKNTTPKLPTRRT